ncbi:MAG TPA: NADH-quinone oxidoreductase subunit L [Alphaproteobacteria bacterium]|nr:NADH-quinone oxidoreductase subunit L [Alphaproteobacteria bacterium]
MIYVAAIFLPLAGSIIAGLFGPFLRDKGAHAVTCGAMLLAAVLGIVIFWQVAIDGQDRTIHLLSWVNSGSLEFSWALKFDTLSAVMVFIVTLVSCVVHWYSIGYLHGDPGVPRFFAYLSLFTFSMLMLVTASNLVQLFFGWEGVGLCSYLLIGFWYDRPAAVAAAIKAFVVNRVGDFGFALGIFGAYLLFDTVNLDTIFTAVPGKENAIIDFLGMHLPAIETLCVLLFIGAMGKSAQIGLHTWLPDAMEGPTPVSALIHAATMVTAGVFMVCRLSPMFEHAPTALALVTFVGATTCFFAASVGLTQFDIKRVIAYSTCSQLGYMFFAAGVSAYQAAIFHLMTHAFFKALLFLGAGCVIHAMSGEQDMRKMGGLWRKIPISYGLMWIGSLALAGIPPFAGYFSKDVVIEAAWGAHTGVGNYAYLLGVAAAFMTAFYSWRLIFMTFHGESRADHHTQEHVHESPSIMIVPLYVLALGAIVAGFIGSDTFVGEGRAEFWRDSIVVLAGHDALEAGHHAPLLVKILPTILGLAGIALAYLFYIKRPELPQVYAQRFRALYLLSFHKWYFDEIYDALFVRPALALGRGLWKGGDGAIIDGLGPDGLATATLALARRAGRLQSGYVYHYAFAMLIGVVLIVTWYLYFFVMRG